MESLLSTLSGQTSVEGKHINPMTPASGKKFILPSPPSLLFSSRPPLAHSPPLYVSKNIMQSERIKSTVSNSEALIEKLAGVILERDAATLRSV